MVKSCYVCTHECFPNCGLSFHRFPKDPTMRALWVNALPYIKRKLSHYAVVCSRHFKTEDYDMRLPWKRLLKKDAVPSLRLSQRKVPMTYYLGESPDSTLDFEPPSTPEDHNAVSESLIDSSTHWLRPKNNEVASACNSDNDSETQDAEYLDIEESSSSYKPSESSSEEDQNDVPQTENNTIKSVKKEIITNNDTPNECVNIDSKDFNQAIDRIDKIAEGLSKNEDDEFDGFGKYIATTLRSLPTKMAIIATKEIHKTITEIKFKSKMDKH